MAQAQKPQGKGVQQRGKGVRKFPNLVDVIYEFPLGKLLSEPPSLLRMRQLFLSYCKPTQLSFQVKSIKFIEWNPPPPQFGLFSCFYHFAEPTQLSAISKSIKLTCLIEFVPKCRIASGRHVVVSEGVCETMDIKYGRLVFDT